MEPKVLAHDATPRRFYAASTYPSEDYGVDIKDDTAKPYNKIHPSSMSLRRQMVEIARHSSVRVNARRWIERLRFLKLESDNGSDPLGEKRLKAKVLRTKI